MVTTMVITTTTTTKTRKLPRSANKRMKALQSVKPSWVTTLVNTSTLTPLDVNSSTTSSLACNGPLERLLLDQVFLVLSTEQQLDLLSSLDLQQLFLEHMPSSCTARSTVQRSILHRPSWEISKATASRNNSCYQMPFLWHLATIFVKNL